MYNLSDQDTISAKIAIDIIKTSSLEDTLKCQNVFIDGHFDLAINHVDTVKCALDFFNSTFLGNVNLSGAIFENVTSFHNATIMQLVAIKGSIFKSHVGFSSVTFNQNVIIEYSKFNKNLIFDEAVINSGFRLNQSKIDSFASFIGVSFENVQFEHVTFLGYVSFVFAHFKDKSEFIETTFFDDVSFFRAKFNNYFNLRGNFHSIVDLSETIFVANADLRYSEFFNGSFITLHNMSYNKLLINWNQISNKIVFNDTQKDQSITNNRNMLLSENNANIEDIINVYKTLEYNFINLGRFGDADACYIRRKLLEENNCKNNNDYWPYYQSLVFKKLCLYGTKPIKIVYWGAVVFLLSSVLYFIFEFSFVLTTDKNGKTILKSFSFFILSYFNYLFLSIQKNFLSLLNSNNKFFETCPEKKVVTIIKIIIWSEKIILYLLFTLFIIIISNRLIR